jgi:nucleotide-binding universal stress UspA family protein
MFSKVMVPLDGSQFSECSLEQVKAIAHGCNVPEVILLNVVEPISGNEEAALLLARDDIMIKGQSPDESEGGQTNVNYSDKVMAVMGQKRAQAQVYVSEMESKLIKDGLSARGEVMVGKPAETILDYAEKTQVDLIVMTSHGRSGISRFAFGSVADRVARHSTVPVLLVTPPGCRISLS